MKNLSIPIILTAGILILTGCSSKNLTVDKTTPKLQVDASKTTIKGNSEYIEIENDLQVSETYQIRECKDKTVYLGFATNYLKEMLGLDTYRYDANGKKIRDNMPLLMVWIASPIFLPFATGMEILFLQPLYDYKDINVCDDYENKTTEKKQIANTGTFNGTVLITNSDNTQSLNLNLSQKTLPIKLPLKDENDMFAASKKSIDASNGYSVKIDGQYIVDGNSVKVQQEQHIK